MRRLLCLLALAGCGDIIGLNGYTDQTQTDGGPSGGDATADGVAMPDSKPNDVVMETCTPTTEDCTNGKDDDCNGLTDCQDPACQMGFSCVPPPPNGWTLTAYHADMRPACASGYAMPLDVQEGINAAAAMCGCGCTTTQPTCTNGNLTFTAGTGGNCNNLTNQTVPASNNCTTITSFATNNQSIKVTPPSPSGGSCTASPTKSVPMVSYQHTGRTCSYAGKAGAGCMNQDVCTPKAAPFTACVAKAGMEACPTGYAVQHFVGSMLTDTRDCSACTCTFNAGTCGGTATFYTDNGCTQNPQTFTVNNQCQAAANRTWRRYRYTPATNATCAGSAVNATGGVSFGDLQTVCCAN